MSLDKPRGQHTMFWMPRTVRRKGRWRLMYQPQASPFSRQQTHTACHSVGRTITTVETSQTKLPSTQSPAVSEATNRSARVAASRAPGEQ